MLRQARLKFLIELLWLFHLVDETITAVTEAQFNDNLGHLLALITSLLVLKKYVSPSYSLHLACDKVARLDDLKIKVALAWIVERVRDGFTEPARPGLCIPEPLTLFTSVLFVLLLDQVIQGLIANHTFRLDGRWLLLCCTKHHVIFLVVSLLMSCQWCLLLHYLPLTQLLYFSDDFRGALILQVGAKSRQLRHWFAS